jgi:hypothetical protein
MTEEDRKLLLKELSARLPYFTKVQIKNEIVILDSICDDDGYYFNFIGDDREGVNIENIKPCLFPLSSMTEEQKKEYNFWKHEVPVCHYEYGDVVEDVELFDSPESFEYLIENHFDYYGLIEKGLAIDATNKNIY